MNNTHKISQVSLQRLQISVHRNEETFSKRKCETTTTMAELQNFSEAYLEAQRDMWQRLKIESKAREDTPLLAKNNEIKRSTTSYEIDFVDGTVVDEDFIEEQTRILARIQQEHETIAHGKMSNFDQNKCKPHRLTSFTPMLDGTTNNYLRNSHAPITDHTIKRRNQTINVKGTDHAISAIADGTAVLVQCSSCYTILQIGDSAKHIYCPHCTEVTPMDVAVEVMPSRVGASDDLIARSLQHQEMTVSRSRKKVAPCESRLSKSTARSA